MPEILFTGLATLMLICVAAQKGVMAQAPSDSDVNHYVWDLSSLYPSDEAWQAESTIARYRKFKDGIEALLFQDGLPANTQKTMVGFTRANLSGLHRYLNLRRRALSLERLTYSDLFAPLPSGDRRFTVPETMEAIVSASAPLGADYQARLRERLRQPWFHLAPAPGKRDTYGLWYSVGGANPYGIMNYNGDIASSSSFAGMATLMMAYADIPRDNPPDTRQDPPIYTNAVIYAGMILHDDYLRNHAADRRERIAYLIHSLDTIRLQYFRWALVSDFEAKVEDLVSKGDMPAGAQLSETYLRLLREYYGHDRGVVTVDDAFGAEWMYMRVSFNSFETQGFPLAMAAGCLLAEKARAGDENAKRGFHEVLRRGESDLSYDLLRRSGVDLASTDTYGAVVRRMNSLMDELEKLLDGNP